MVDVEQHALRALEQDAPPPPPRLVEVAPDRPGKGQHEFGNLGEVAAQAIAVDRRFVPLGAPVYLATTFPLTEEPLERLMAATRAHPRRGRRKMAAMNANRVIV